MACRTGLERGLRYYELMMVVSPQVDEEGLSATLDRVNRYVTEHGGSVMRQEQWGRLRRLAYPIRNFNEGNYILTHLEMDQQDTKDLEASLILTEDVLRHLLVRIDAIPPAPAPKAEPVEAAAVVAEAPAEAATAEASMDDAPLSTEAQAPEAPASEIEPEAAAEPAAPAEEREEPAAAAEGTEEPPAQEPETSEAQ